MPTRSTIRYTYQDYLGIPEDTSRRYEIVDGELFVTPTPRFRHQEVVTSLAHILRGLSDEHGLGKVVVGPITVRLHDELVLEPDVAFVSTDRLDIVDPEGIIDGAPDLVVEVLSPSNRTYDRNLKRKRYLDNGVSEVWIVDADERTIEVWRPGADRAVITGESLSWKVGDRRLDIQLMKVFAT